MGHTIRDKQKLLNRIKRIRGQVDAIERVLEKEGDCIDILQQIASCRGAMTGLLAVVLELVDKIESDFARLRVGMQRFADSIDPDGAFGVGNIDTP